MKKTILFILGLSLLWMNKGMAQTPLMNNDSLLVIQEGTASFYGKKFHKRKTASGEVFDMNEHTAAHKHLPFGTLLKVTNLKNGHEVIVKVNDRLPQHSKRIIDLSRTAAEQLAMIRDGLTSVQLMALSFQEIEKLKDHFEIIPEELRLRVYYEPVQPTTGIEIFSPLLFQKDVTIVGLSSL
ncbi:MAG TPA: septal ring lytic transglycosylase RlpA family protein [Cyclobacteriaceae bacterium]|nr:septal ring lytic transglycosylase RlpA family protein [Cyclobacteriaceae bacterium]